MGPSDAESSSERSAVGPARRRRRAAAAAAAAREDDRASSPKPARNPRHTVDYSIVDTHLPPGCLTHPNDSALLINVLKVLYVF